MQDGLSTEKISSDPSPFSGENVEKNPDANEVETHNFISGMQLSFLFRFLEENKKEREKQCGDSQEVSDFSQWLMSNFLNKKEDIGYGEQENSANLRRFFLDSLATKLNLEKKEKYSEEDYKKINSYLMSCGQEEKGKIKREIVNKLLKKYLQKEAEE